MSYKPIDARRDEFRKYLERTGVLDMFTKVLSKLMTETDKPEDALEFIRANIGDSLNDKDTVEALNLKLEDAQQLIQELRSKLSQYEPMDVSEVASVPEAAAADQELTAPATPASAAPKEDEPTEMQVESPKEPVTTSTTPAEVVASTETVADPPAAASPPPPTAAAAAPTPVAVEPTVTETLPTAEASADKTEEKEKEKEVENKDVPAPESTASHPAPATTEEASQPKPDEKMEN